MDDLPTALPTAQQIEAAARSAGMSIAEMCRRAGIAASVFHRWKANASSPTLDVVQRLHAVVSRPERAASN